MSPFYIFLLAVTALIGLVLVIKSPSASLEKWLRGKTTKQAGDELNKQIKESELSDVVGKGCGFVLYLLMSFFYTFVVEPLVVITALVNDIGDQTLALVMLGIVALSWILTVRQWTKGSRKDVTIKTKDGEEVKGSVIDEPIKLGNPRLNSFKRGFFAAPTFYLWYILVVALGLIP